MAKRIKNFFKEYRNLLILLVISCLIIFFQFLFQGKTFEMMNDQKFQGNLYYKEWIRLLSDFIKTGEWPFYSWYNFLGTDYFTTKMFYCNSDIFVLILIVLVTGLHKSIEYSMLVITILMVLISGISMRAYLKKIKIKNGILMDIISLIYALSGVMTLYFCNYHFSRFYCFLPLLFLGVEKYLQDDKKIFFIFASFLLFFQDYYFMFPTSFFLVGYFIASYYAKNNKDKFINCLKKALPLIGYYLIGVLMAGIVLVPTIFYITKNTRVGAGTGGILFEPEVYLSIIERMFVPPYYVNNDLPKIFFDATDGGHISWSSIYATAIIPISLLSFKSILKKDSIKPFYICYLVYFICFLIKPLNSIIHGFSNVTFRWSFLLIFLGLVLASMAIDQELIDKNVIKPLSIFFVLVILFTVLLIVFNRIDFKETWKPLLILLGMFILAYLYVFMICKKKYKLLIGLVCVELIVGNTFVCRYNSKDFFYYEDSINEEYIEYFLTNNQENYLRRIYIDSHDIMPAGELNQNNSLNYRYMGTMCYDSTYEYVLNPFLNYIGLGDREIDRIIDINDPEILRLLAVRYVGVYDESQLKEYQDGYTYAFDLNALHMYELNNNNSIGHTFSNFIKTSEFNNNIDWNNTLIINDEDYDFVKDIKESSKSQLEVLEYSNDYFKGRINTQDDTVLFVSIPYSKGWKVFDENGNRLETFNVDGGFTGLIIDKGEHELIFRFTSPNFKLGCLVSGVGFVAFGVVIFMELRKKKRGLVK